MEYFNQTSNIIIEIIVENWILFIIGLTPIFYYLNYINKTNNKIRKLETSILSLRTINQLLTQKIQDLEKITYQVEDNEIKEDIIKLYNVVNNIMLYYQNKKIGPHNVNNFIKLLEKDYSEDILNIYKENYFDEIPESIINWESSTIRIKLIEYFDNKFQINHPDSGSSSDSDCVTENLEN